MRYGYYFILSIPVKFIFVMLHENYKADLQHLWFSHEPSLHEKRHEALTFFAANGLNFVNSWFSGLPFSLSLAVVMLCSSSVFWEFDFAASAVMEVVVVAASDEAARSANSG